MSVPSSIAAGAAWRGAPGHRRKSDCYVSSNRRGSYLPVYDAPPSRRSRGQSIFEVSSTSSPHCSSQHLRPPGHSVNSGRHRRLSGDIYDASRRSGNPSSPSSICSQRRHSHHHPHNSTEPSIAGDNGCANKLTPCHCDCCQKHQHHSGKYLKGKQSISSVNESVKPTDMHSNKNEGKPREGRSKRTRNLCILLVIGMIL